MGSFYVQDIKYFFAYFFPASFFISLYLGPPYYWLLIVVAFGILPLLELVLPQSKKNTASVDEAIRISNVVFDWILYSNIFIVYIALYLSFIQFNNVEILFFDKIYLSISLGILLSTSGINVSHELGHRVSRVEKIMSSILLLPSLYMHFTIEHNYGHHLHVATPEDPASSRKGETIYAFWFRSIFQTFISSFQIENVLMKSSNRKYNRVMLYLLIEVIFMLTLFLFFGINTLLFFLLAAIVSILLLESINYIEHYGITRGMKENGKYEPVLPKHSWNSNHALGRIVLYELTRHSDHHFKSTRKYQNLRYLDPSPQLMTGYPGSILLSLVPPLWFKYMHKRYDQFLKETKG